MDPDREVCLCFHVTLRKLQHFLRVESPRRVSQLSECFGAGTGCGWCRPVLERLFATGASDHAPDLLPDPQDYTAQRTRYLEQQPSASQPDLRPTDNRPTGLSSG